MTSPVLLGTTQVSERGLANHATNTWGSWAGTFGVGGVALFLHSFTIRNPNGAPVYGFTTMSSYTTTFASAIYGGLWVDGVYTTSYGAQFYPYASYHTAQSYEWWTGTLSPGAHTINTGLYVSGGTCTFDGSDGGTSICWEHP